MRFSPGYLWSMADDQPSVAVRTRIHGRVQGVWFRAWTQQEAVSRGLRGWVRNRRDGSVEAVFAGPESQVRDMIAVCHQGPPAARVEAVEEFPADETGLAGFDTRPTE